MKKRLIGTFVAAAVLAPALTLVGTGQAFAAGNPVTWKNKYSGKYLAYVNNRVRTINADPTQSASLKWDEFKQRDGAYVMQHHMTGKCLDSNSHGDVYLLNCNGGDYQRWYESHDSSGWRLKNKATGRVLEELTTGKIQTAKDEGYPVQRWS